VGNLGYVRSVREREWDKLVVKVRKRHNPDRQDVFNYRAALPDRALLAGIVPATGSHTRTIIQIPTGKLRPSLASKPLTSGHSKRRFAALPLPAN
jgi:hypothetical protein